MAGLGAGLLFQTTPGVWHLPVGRMVAVGHIGGVLRGSCAGYLVVIPHGLTEAPGRGTKAPEHPRRLELRSMVPLDLKFRAAGALGRL